VAGKWSTSTFPLPATAYNQVVRDPGDSKRLFATDGNSVARSTDQGCTWTSVFGTSLPDTSAAPNGPTAVPTGYYLSSIVATGGPNVYLTLAPSPYMAVPGTFGPSAPPVFVLASSDGGASFSLTTPLPSSQPRCMTSSLAVSPSAPKTLYLACYGTIFLQPFVPPPAPVPGPADLEPLSSPQVVFYVSTDGGGSWTRQSQKGLPTLSLSLNDLVVDPFRANELWGRVNLNAATQTIVIVHSTDAAKTWTVAYQGPAVAGDPTMLGFSFSRATPSTTARLVAWGPAGAVQSSDEGSTWTALATPAGGVYRAAFDATGDHVAVSYSTGAPCAATAKLFVFDTKRPGKAPTVSPVTLSPASRNLFMTSLARTNAAASSFTGITRIYQQPGSAPDVVACTVPGSPPPPPPAPPVTTSGTGQSWTNVIVTYRD
jgi:hypothetical protein